MTNSNPTAVETGEQWPHDLVAFKWAETLSQGEQDVLLARNLKQLQQRINSALQHREQEVRAEGWLPIESAPRGERILIAFPNGHVQQHVLKPVDTKVVWFPNGDEPDRWMPLPTAAVRRDDTTQEGER